MKTAHVQFDHMVVKNLIKRDINQMFYSITTINEQYWLRLISLNANKPKNSNQNFQIIGFSNVNV